MIKSVGGNSTWRTLKENGESFKVAFFERFWNVLLL